MKNKLLLVSLPAILVLASIVTAWVVTSTVVDVTSAMQQTALALNLSAGAAEWLTRIAIVLALYVVGCGEALGLILCFAAQDLLKARQAAS